MTHAWAHHCVCKVGCRLPEEQERVQCQDCTISMNGDKTRKTTASGNGEKRVVRNRVFPLYHCESLRNTVETEEGVEL